ncbi:MAG: hypothetical protein H6Q21_1345 [Bacteroidetes bacterium]|nr:hypothetical protein [Bacteroidota bacterium]
MRMDRLRRLVFVLAASYRLSFFTYPGSWFRPLDSKNKLLSCYLCILSGPVVQLNRTSDSGSGSRGFESRRGHNEAKRLASLFAFFMHQARNSTGGISSGLAVGLRASESSRRGHKKGSVSHNSALFLCTRYAA